MNPKKLARQLAAQSAAAVQLKNTLDSKRFHPMADQVLLEIEVEGVSSGGIIKPASAQQNELSLPIGRVLEVGPDVKRVKVGDGVLVSQRDVSKIDVLLWLAAETKLLCRVDARSALLT